MIRLDKVSIYILKKTDHYRPIVRIFYEQHLKFSSQVLRSSCEYKVVMFPFVEKTSGNLDNLQAQASTIPNRIWKEFILRTEALFNGFQVDVLKVSVLKTILKLAFIFNIPSARPLIGHIIESLPNEGGLYKKLLGL